MSTAFSIAIDGPAGAGKSTVAKAVAGALHALYLDTGAMYRAFGLAIKRMGVDIFDATAVAGCVNSVEINVAYQNGSQRLFIGSDDVTDLIRTPEISEAASAVSAVPEVRKRLVALQQKIAEGHSVVMDGRDIGTVVLPNATLKVYLTASAEARARRRMLELEQNGTTQPYHQVLSGIQARDDRDTHREASPLRVSDDAVVVDTSDLTLDESIEAVMALARERGL